MRAIIYAAAVAGLVAPVAAQAMTVETFLAKTNALKKKGLFAIGSSDLGLLKTEMQGVTEGYRAEVAAARAAGRTPPSCPPAKGSAKARMSAGEFLGELERIPAAQARTMSMKTAFYAMMKRRFPCPA